jgi:predicted ATPase/class 3 adenylate cyclase
MNLPSGTVTFLFTDIEGSTRLWEEQPDTMRLALARHDVLLRAAIETNGGTVFKTIGDAFCAAFATAPPALEAALSAQKSLLQVRAGVGSDLLLKVRMALHTGAADLQDGDYFGQPLNRVARLLAAGHGGQILLSLPAEELVRDSLPARAAFKDLGEHRLRDLGRTETVFQLLHPDLPSEFAPLKSLDNPDLPNNLSQQVTSFIGREKEIEAVKSLLGKTRLLTLTGSGGCGKTRLGLQVAAEVLDQFPEGAWLVELAPLAIASLVPQTVANSLGVTEEAGKPILQTLTEQLKTRRLLLLLDNCEHLLDACAHLADALLRLCPNVKILTTSREGLGIAGETTYRVPSLSLPDPKRDTTPEQIGTYESVRLFIERACAAQPAFSVTNQNAPALAAMCRRLDGIPLAIELAAARARSLSVEEINSKLDQRFRLLTGGSRTALPRQQTLRSLIDWSYDLLSDPEKSLLQRVSVFAGGWTLESAEQVCSSSGDGIEDWEVLDLLTGLADKSLVGFEQRDGKTRYGLLETVRQYGRDRLLESGENEAIRARHRDHFLSLAEQAEPELTGSNQVAWMERLEVEHDNLRAALEWSAREPGGAEAGLRISGAISRFWIIRGHLSEGRMHLERALGREDPQSRTKERAKALNGAGNILRWQGDYVAARTPFEESLEIRREIGDQLGVARSLGNLGLVSHMHGDYTTAQSLSEESLAISRKLGDRWGIALTLGNLGEYSYYAGAYAAARAFQEEALAIQRELNDQWGIANALKNLGDVAQEQGEYAAARAFQQESLTVFKELGDRWGIAEVLHGLGVAAGGQGHADRAARLWGAAEAIREANSTPMDPDEHRKHTLRVAAARESMGNKAFSAAWNEGRSMSMEKAIAYALEVST